MMRVAVVVSFHDKPIAQLEQCLRSVLDQEHPAEIVLVADGAAGWDVCSSALEQTRSLKPDRWHIGTLLRLPVAHGDDGNCARAIGAIEAISAGVDAVAFLDADNWYERDHVARLVALHEQTGAPICSASLWGVRLDGSRLYTHGENDGERHVDTSCLFLTRAAFSLLPLWALIPPQLKHVGDRVFWGMLKSSGLQRAHSMEPTLNYRTAYAVDYTSRGEEPPPGCKGVAVLPDGKWSVDVPAVRFRAVTKKREDT